MSVMSKYSGKNIGRIDEGGKSNAENDEQSFSDLFLVAYECVKEYVYEKHAYGAADEVQRRANGV